MKICKRIFEEKIPKVSEILNSYLNVAVVSLNHNSKVF